MNKYVVALYSDYDGTIQMDEVSGSSKVNAAIKFLQSLEVELKDEFYTMESLKREVTAMEHSIEVLQIDKKNWKHHTSKGPLHAPVPHFEH